MCCSPSMQSESRVLSFLKWEKNQMYLVLVCFSLGDNKKTAAYFSQFRTSRDLTTVLHPKKQHPIFGMLNKKTTYTHHKTEAILIHYKETKNSTKRTSSCVLIYSSLLRKKKPATSRKLARSGKILKGKTIRCCLC